MDKNDLISRSATLHAMKMDPAPPFRVVMEMPAIDPEEMRPRGKWVKPHWRNSTCCMVCSVCNSEAQHGDFRGVEKYYHYCPNCGAKMTED